MDTQFLQEQQVVNFGTNGQLNIGGIPVRTSTKIGDIAPDELHENNKDVAKYVDGIFLKHAIDSNNAVAKMAVKYQPDYGGVADMIYQLIGHDWLYIHETETFYCWENNHWNNTQPRRMNNVIDEILSRFQTAIKYASVKNVIEHDDATENDSNYVFQSRKHKDAYKSAYSRTANKTSGIVEQLGLKLNRYSNDINMGNYINFPNGVYNLDDCTLQASDKRMVFDYVMSYAYDPTADCPKWEKFLSEVIVTEQVETDADGNETVSYQTDHDQIAKLQEIIGYSFTNDKSIHPVVAMLYGGGNNGKGVILDTWAKLHGPLAYSVDFHKIALPGNYTESELVNKRFVYQPESERGESFSHQWMKSASEGSKRQARPIYGKEFVYTPRYTIAWSFNDKPLIKETNANGGVWRRMAFFNFPRQFKPEQINVMLKHELVDELPGIFNWCMEGWQRLQQNRKFTVSATEQQEKEAYRKEQNPVQQFIDHCTVLTDTQKTPSNVIYAVYEAWCKHHGYKAFNDTNLGIQLKGIDGIKKKRTNKGYAYNIAFIKDALIYHSVPKAYQCQYDDNKEPMGVYAV